MKNLFILIFVSLGLVGCKVDPAKNMYKAKIDDKYLCLEKQYFDWGDDPDDDGIFIIMMRPDMKPQRQLGFSRPALTDDERINKTRLSLSIKSSEEILTAPRAIESGKKRARQYPPTEEKKYELIMAGNNTKVKGVSYYFEPNQNFNDFKAAHIRCSIEGKPKYPQCGHYFYDDTFHYKIGYSMKNLPNWKKIKQQVIDFVESKKCEKDTDL
jgi:hypothetical protein